MKEFERKSKVDESMYEIDETTISTYVCRVTFAG
jgi:hypothetical protein